MRQPWTAYDEQLARAKEAEAQQESKPLQVAPHHERRERQTGRNRRPWRGNRVQRPDADLCVLHPDSQLHVVAGPTMRGVPPDVILTQVRRCIYPGRPGYA